jgi:hypothetical protein
MVRAGKWTVGTSTPGQQTCFALAAAGHATITEIEAIVSVRPASPAGVQPGRAERTA